jgi:hypothetical protein
LVHAEIAPHNFTLCLLVTDIVSAEWDILRLRGLKVGMLHAAMTRVFNKQRAEETGFASLESPLVPVIRKHIVATLAGDKTAKQELEALLKAHGLTLDFLVAGAFESTIVPQVHADRMLSEALNRRNRAYAEIEYYWQKHGMKRTESPQSVPDIEGAAKFDETERLDDGTSNEDMSASEDGAAEAPLAPKNG